MTEYLVIGFIIFGLIVGISVFFLAKKIFTSDANAIIGQAKAKAQAIEYEAQNLLKNEQFKIKEIELELHKKHKEETSRVIREYEHKLSSIQAKEDKMSQKIEREMKFIEEEKQKISDLKNKLLTEQESQNKLHKQYKEAKEKALNTLVEYTGYTKEEAKSLLLKYLEDDLIMQKSNMIRRYEHQAREEAMKKANYIIAQATTRFAGEFANERLINVVNLPNDELKGRIIGKEGRNIKTLENISGVDVIIDDTPGTIILSSFNLYRRAIATKTVELLVEDGRIQPSRIEEVYAKVSSEMEDQILQDGENIILDMGLGYMHPELKKLIGKMKYRASFGQNALGHSIEVANLAGVIAGELGGDEKLARRAGLLHDIGKALTQECGGNHVALGVEVCKRYKEHPVVMNAIMSHHGDEEIASIEAAAVCTADALSAGRPGARREVLESFLKRMQDLERIAMDKIGVKQAYAVNSGKEIRVIVRADLLDDAQSVILARDIAQEVESTLQYPGEIKVNVIRESRAVEFAK
ncbi:ribonuclease Y [Helicobacter cappadocius]|uniref:Ribonuclease Y n=1 Tax=Helicobacter cappadocius TaxID=3063998 RepID=A0AA90PKA7_9HELI|nr:MULTISPECIES: ribonuclease Y [unclassified Helicobacter]MDO7253155.1 ribonuclease Y [Helicobacter sp. faydin-H75]MDP2538719.1 ribonuclease Y [Helicobacter sp. faydin-H76]